MKTMLLILVTASMAHAGIKPYTGSRTAPNPDYKEIYMVEGHSIPPNEAFTAAIRGSEVYRCVNQEISMGKTGKSAGLKNVKKNQ